MNQADIDALVSQRLPDWAIRRAAGLELGAHLPTRDGRISGNAHIVDIKPAPRGRIGLNYLILTDAGNTFIMSEPEIAAQYYPPEFVGDLGDIITKFWRQNEPLIAV
jgi:hypothetical protein